MRKQILMTTSHLLQNCLSTYEAEIDRFVKKLVTMLCNEYFFLNIIV